MKATEIWIWWWGTEEGVDFENVFTFSDFNEMKDFSAWHSHGIKSVRPVVKGYFSTYEKITLVKK